MLHFGVLPALVKVGLAPLLVEDIGSQTGSMLMGFAGFCAVLQLLLLARLQGAACLVRDARGQLLWAVLVACAAYLAVAWMLADAVRWQLLCYLVAGVTGLVLVVQPVPSRARRIGMSISGIDARSTAACSLAGSCGKPVPSCR